MHYSRYYTQRKPDGSRVVVRYGPIASAHQTYGQRFWTYFSVVILIGFVGLVLLLIAQALGVRITQDEFSLTFVALCGVAWIGFMAVRRRQS
jgi:hypothetical protein